MRTLARGRTGDSSSVRLALGSWLARNPGIVTLSVFSPLPDEPDLTDVVLAHPERSWVYPRVEGDLLVFHRVVDPASGLRPGRFGIPEPSIDLEVIEPWDIDAFLCPGMAFDRRGGRLGRGRGFYDRILAKARPDALRLGVCFPDQVVADIHGEPHDIRMHELLV